MILPSLKAVHVKNRSVGVSDVTGPVLMAKEAAVMLSQPFNLCTLLLLARYTPLILTEHRDALFVKTPTKRNIPQ
ncbi:hypothetical protein RRG08_035056 [Elysia crispata]|uniref:Uncharacterized protein n=1 Tax=Elysia crispata TaxID=231223 RepID=A0AAE1DMA9_9GAST|nr:hypothetical protein RRG08_035056 [Elysia crispata]